MGHTVSEDSSDDDEIKALVSYKGEESVHEECKMLGVISGRRRM